MAVGCVIAAGDPLDKRDPVAAHVGEPCKAMVCLRDKRLVEYVIDAVQHTERITQTVVIGCQALEPILDSYGIPWLAGRAGMLDNFMEGSRYLFETYLTIDRVLITMADIPLLTPPHLDWFIDACATTDHDFYWAIIRKDTMQQRFPDSRRTYARASDGAFCSGDLLLVRRTAFRTFITHSEYWNWAIQNRKSVWPMLFKFGLRSWVRFLIGRITVSEIEQALQDVFGIRVRAVISPYAEHGMDIDKPFQLEIVARELVSFSE